MKPKHRTATRLHQRLFYNLADKFTVIQMEIIATAFASFCPVKGIPLATTTVSQWEEVTRAETEYDTGSMGDLGQPLCICNSHHCKLCQQYKHCGALVSSVCIYVCAWVHMFVCGCVYLFVYKANGTRHLHIF